MRASAQARTTPMRVSLASAYTAAGITQIAVSRQPGPAAIAFMVRERPTQATLRVRGRSARRPCSASAMPRAAKISAPVSGMPASSAAIAGTCRAWRTMTYCASQLTTAAAAASSASAAMALRSHARPPSAVWLAAGRLAGLAGAACRGAVHRWVVAGQWVMWVTASSRSQLD